MNLPRRLRVPSLLLLGLLLAAGPLAAATPGHGSRGAGLNVPGALSQMWAFVSRFWTKVGSGIDPFGKEGNSIDPFGKAGNSIDPFGQPAPSSLAPSYGGPAESQPAPGR